MKFNVIQTLRLACTGFMDPEMTAAYVQLPESHQADQLMWDAIAAGNLAELDELITDSGCERENQGFINGFRTGVRLMSECTMPAPLDIGHPDERGADGQPHRPATVAPVDPRRPFCGGGCSCKKEDLQVAKSRAEDVQAGFGGVKAVVGALDDYIYNQFMTVEVEGWPKEYIKYHAGTLQSLLCVVTHLLADMEEEQDKLVHLLSGKAVGGT